MYGKGLISGPSLVAIVYTRVDMMSTGGPVYRFPRDLEMRRRRAYVIIPLLFYGSALIAMAVSGPVETWNVGFLSMVMLFLTLVVAFLLVLVRYQRPWVELHQDTMRVGRHEFQVSDLRSVIVYLDRKLMFERPPYQLIFLVVEPDYGPKWIYTDPIRNVQDLDSVVRDLRGLLPDVAFLDRTLSGGPSVPSEILDRPVGEIDQSGR